MKDFVAKFEEVYSGKFLFSAFKRLLARFAKKNCSHGRLAMLSLGIEGLQQVRISNAAAEAFFTSGAKEPRSALHLCRGCG